MEKAMKVTKERLQEIIKEEVENAKQELASADSKQAMINKLREIAKLFPKTQGIDKIEIQLLTN